MHVAFQCSAGRLVGDKVVTQKRHVCAREWGGALLACAPGRTRGLARRAVLRMTAADESSGESSWVVPQELMLMSPKAVVTSVLGAFQRREGELGQEVHRSAVKTLFQFASPEYMAEMGQIVEHNPYWDQLDVDTYIKYLGANGYRSILLNVREFEFLEGTDEAASVLGFMPCTITSVLLADDVARAVHWTLTKDLKSGEWKIRDFCVDEKLEEFDARLFIDGPQYLTKPSLPRGQEKMKPSSAHDPSQVAMYVMSALRCMDSPTLHHGCQVLLDFMSPQMCETVLHLMSFANKDPDLSAESLAAFFQHNSRWHLLRSIAEYAIAEEPRVSEDGRSAELCTYFFSVDDFGYRLTFTFTKDRLRCWTIDDILIQPASDTELERCIERADQ
ncbi:hypothetical protein FVE85_0621 [Porphyridium purpureum]|uniref:Uncharacterized protein n=1 Tax=Porphyridium purpureum TaxID=35688 RepID=A0A5J4Z178_PORPP|nr:hypothetical protein FVE85_0621 [Porphyridium purpureum]|eukprot:POR5352..scf208_2